MKLRASMLLLALAAGPGFRLGIAGQTNRPVIHMAIAVHSEEPGGPITARTPDFRTVDATTYDAWRRAILWFADACHRRNLPWSFQSDWNFLEGIRRFETATGANYTPAFLSDGKNTLKYMQENLGVELDPHSHENSGYNYADVAWLVDVGCDATPSGVVGGHIYDPNSLGYQDWPKFIRDPDGLKGNRYPYAWRPHLLMGAASLDHTSDPHAAGLWRPAGTNDFFSHSPAGDIAAIATWERDLHETDLLLRALEDGSLAHSNKLWTIGHVFHHREMIDTTNRNIILAQLETIRRWRDAGRVTVSHFETIYRTWTNAPYNGESSLYLRPDDYVSFSLNWQDFFYPEDSATELRLLLDTHETFRVPVDVFLTTWQVDLFESTAPDLLGRLQSSAWVSMGYHVRPPKPYANDFVWTNVSLPLIADYETHGLNLTNGLPTAAPGGYAKLTALMGYAPPIVGPNNDLSVAALVHGYFASAGAGLLVQHSSRAVNLRDRANGVYLRPEHYDWRLIGLFRGETTVTNLDLALAAARASIGGKAPWFVGVKLHDNDLFAEQSAWTWVYQATNRPPSQRAVPPWDLSTRPALLSPATRLERRAAYTNLVASAAARRATVNLVDSRNILSLLTVERPRVVGLQSTSIPETSAVGTVVGRLTGGGAASGVACDYALVSGEGDLNNADFAISGDQLLAARPLDFETEPVKRIRVRWTDGGGHTGERALTLVLANLTTDDDDGDGHTEAQELAAGTNPLDAQSVLRASISRTGGGDLLSITIESVPGRSYVIEVSTNLVDWAAVFGGPITATDTTLVRPVPAESRTKAFYRVRLW